MGEEEQKKRLAMMARRWKKVEDSCLQALRLGDPDFLIRFLRGQPQLALTDIQQGLVVASLSEALLQDMASEDEHATFRAINNMRFHLGQLRELLSGVTVTNAGVLFNARAAWRRRLVRGERLFSIIDREYCQGLSARPPRQQYRSWEVRTTLVECRVEPPPLPDISAHLDAHLAASTSSRWQRALASTTGSG